LLLSFGLLTKAHPELPGEEIWKKICLIDTENNSSNLYEGIDFQGLHIGEFNMIDLTPPFTPQRYLEAIKVAEDGGIECLIIDSLSHAWSGEGGMLDMQGAISRRIGNSYTAWREVTPLHNKLVDKILQCNMHVVICLRAKTEYVLEEGPNGKKTPIKKGMAPIFRDGLEYEVSTFFDLGQDHLASASKDRTNLFDGQIFQITPETGAIIYEWLSKAKPASPAKEKKQPDTDTEDESLAARVDALMKQVCQGMTGEEKQEVARRIKDITGGTANYHSVTDVDTLNKIMKEFSVTP
jgi:hypothetical protein